jgi:hypothetical protein
MIGEGSLLQIGPQGGNDRRGLDLDGLTGLGGAALAHGETVDEDGGQREPESREKPPPAARRDHGTACMSAQVTRGYFVFKLSRVPLALSRE